MTIDQILPILRSTYRSIDIRAILLKPKEKPDSDQWVCVFLKIRLTKETQLELEETHSTVGSLERKYCKVILASKNIQELDALVNEIKNGHITLQGTLSNISGTDWRQILTKTIVRSEMYTTSEERGGYLHGILFISMYGGSIYSVISSLGLSENDFGMKFDLISSRLDARDVFTNSNNIVIIFPIYCRQRIPSQNEIGKILAKYEIHELLIPKCNATIVRSTDLSNMDHKQLKFADCKTQKSDEMIEVLLPMVFPSISPDDWIDIEIRHDILGVIGESKIDTNHVLQPPYGIDPLLDGFHLFKAKERLTEYINSKKEKPQVLSTSWLLALLGFRSIYLGEWSKDDENIYEHQIQIHSADIFSYDSETKTFLAVDCTTTVPDTNKISKIRNTADYLTEKTRHTIIPVIFSSDNCPSILRQQAEANDVFIIGGNDSGLLCDSLLKGHSVGAKGLFHNLIRRSTTEI